MPFIPQPPPQVDPDSDAARLARWAEDEHTAIAAAQNDDVIALELRPIHVEPKRPRVGMLVYADGTDWDPGSGEGVYVYASGGWTAL
jgi:hypothetical protein